MTVAELIEELKKQDPAHEVLLQEPLTQQMVSVKSVALGFVPHYYVDGVEPQPLVVLRNDF